MSKFVRLLGLAALAAIVVGCASSAPKEVQANVGKTYYTQVTFWTYKGEHETTNYGVTQRVPINTQVRINDVGGNVVELTLVDSGREVVLINQEKYTLKGIGPIFDRYFGESRVDLARFDGATREAIEDGEIQTGMTKDAVLLARGYPPAHETPSTDSDSWKYWKSRYDTMVVEFENGRVADTRD